MLSDGHIAEIWAGQRKKYSYEGDCRYDWEKFLDLSFAEQVKTVGDLDISAWPKENPDVQKAKARIDMMTPMGINRMAAALNGKDTRAILEWGNELNQNRVETFKTPHDKSIRDVEGACSQIKGILADYENLLRAQRPTGLRLLFIYIMPLSASDAVKKDLDDYKVQKGLPPSLPQDYRLYTPQQKMARDFKELTSLYVSALKKNRTRLIEEGAKPDTIDNRIIELGRAETACDAEIGHALASGALHEEMRAQMRGILDITIPAFCTEMKTMYLRALGKQALSTKFTGKALGGIVMDKTRTREFADNLNTLADKVRDLSG